MTCRILVVVALAACGGGAASNGANGGNGANGANGSGGVDGSNGSAGATGVNALSKVTASGPSAQCPQGGATIDTGADTDGNGVLGTNEVTSSVQVCQSQLVTRQSAIPFGSTRCPFGGTQVELGIDNGSGGGTAGDGVLQAGEVQSTQYDCGLTANPTQSLTPPAGPAGAFTIDGRGQGGERTGPTATTGVNGGSGANVTIALSNSGGGNIKIFNTGDASAEAASPPAPAQPSNFGASVLDISAGTQVVSYLTTIQAASAATGEVFTLSDQAEKGSLYRRAGSTLVQVTGIHIGPSAVLAPTGTPSVNLFVPGAIVNEGTINGNGTSLQIACGTYYGTTTSALKSNGGDLKVTSAGDIFNSGYLASSPQSFFAPIIGDGGALDLVSTYGAIHNEGTIEANAPGAGYTGGNISLTAAQGIYNSTIIRARGGAQAGNISLLVDGEPNNGGRMQIRNSGKIDASGFDCTSSRGCTTDGASGGAISLTVHGGPLVPGGYVAIANSGQLLAFGASGGTGFGDGGAGGSVTILSDDRSGVDAQGNIQTVAGSVYLSGNIVTRGGVSTRKTGGPGGGSAGPVSIQLNAGVANGQEIVLLGYTDIESQGGDGGTQPTNKAGHGGSVSITNSGSGGGGIVNYANIDTSGGGGAATSQGNGGNILLSSTSGAPAASVTPGQVTINYGRLDLSGGSRPNQAAPSILGYAGHFDIHGAARAENHGQISASDGAAESRPSAGTPQTSRITSGAGPVINTAAITARGGNTKAASRATEGQTLILSGANVVCDGVSLNTTGGSALADQGGRGGDIVLLSTDGVTSHVGSTFLAGAGTSGPNEAPGVNGIVFIDGVSQ